MQRSATEAERASSDATDAAERAGVEMRELHQIDEISQAGRLFDRIWGVDGQEPISVNMMKALAHTGNYVAGAWKHGCLMGASVGFVAGAAGPLSLHSHISGVAADAQGSGVGFALKLHQRAWALDRGIEEITWTYDPLVRRNGWFNLVKLGARAEHYHADFYGAMNDGINGGDPTDRCVVVWALAPEPPGPFATDGAGAGAGGVRLLTEGPDGSPIVAGAPPADAADTVLCQVPVDILAVRHRDPEMGRQWRLGLRATMGKAMDAGYVAASITRDGWYVLRKPA